MITDIVKIKNTGEGIDAAFDAAAAAAQYRGLDKKSALHLRLLTEEMLGMISQITGTNDADFWVTSKRDQFELHLVAYPALTADMRAELIKTSTSGKNSAAKGIMGKVRDVFEKALLNNIAFSDQTEQSARAAISPTDPQNPEPAYYSAAASRMIWSLMSYKSSVQEEKDDKAKDDWDELEKSIVANIADEIKIAIIGDKVEMTVYKNFNK